MAESASFAPMSLLAIPRSSTPASDLGFRVVQRLTWPAAWNVQRWTLVPGHTADAALASPGEPSETSILGGGMRSISAAHALAHSLCARCHPTTWPPATATSTTAFLRSQIPSRNTTS